MLFRGSWKRAWRHAVFVAVFALPFGFGVASGCGQAYEVCEVVCECTHCNDRARDSCEIEVDRMIEVAAAYECETEADAYFECVLNDSECEDVSFTADDCTADELADLLECIADNSEVLGALVGEGEGEGAPEG